jgi:hypothetical protein
VGFYGRACGGVGGDDDHLKRHVCDVIQPSLNGLKVHAVQV